MTIPQILGIGTANPPIRLTQKESFYATGYQSERIRKIFLNSDIEDRHFYFGGTPNLEETSDLQNERYLSGALKTGCRAIMNFLDAAGCGVNEIDFLAVFSCTGYVCQISVAASSPTWASREMRREVPSSVPETNSVSFSKLLDINMMVMTSGRERTKSEFRALLGAADFKVTQIIRTMAPQCIIDARPK